jgi:hypothetical protein
MDKISGIWNRVERSLFPYLQECLPEMTAKHRDLVLVLETIQIEDYVETCWLQLLGRKRANRQAIARAFVAKALYNEPTTKSFIERLRADESLRRICGWERRGLLPSESTFSRAFAEFADTSLADKIHKACVKKYLGDNPVWHISRDSTQIDGREKPASKPIKEAKPKYRVGRPKKGEERPKPEPSRIERQINQSYAESIAELPVVCDVGTKIDSKGSKRHWVGFKFHVDTGDCGIPLSAVTTAASVHDSQVAIPLAKMTAERVESFYDLMDSAYDAKLISGFCEELGHVPIINRSARHGEVEPMEFDRDCRYNNRTTSERFNSQLKDNCGGRMIRVRGKPKVHTHLMFGLLVIFAHSLLSLVN